MCVCVRVCGCNFGENKQIVWGLEAGVRSKEAVRRKAAKRLRRKQRLRLLTWYKTKIILQSYRSAQKHSTPKSRCFWNCLCSKSTSLQMPGRLTITADPLHEVLSLQRLATPAANKCTDSVERLWSVAVRCSFSLMRLGVVRILVHSEALPSWTDNDSLFGATTSRAMLDSSHIFVARRSVLLGFVQCLTSALLRYSAKEM